MSPSLHLHRYFRRESGSNDTTIIIIVCAIIGGLLVLAILYSIFRWCSTRLQKSAPLPPIQPLSHHRERNMAKFYEQNNRPGTVYDNSYLSPRLHVSSVHASKSYLLAGEIQPSSSTDTSSNGSFVVSETGEDISINNMVPMDPALPLPNLPFSSSQYSSFSSSSLSEFDSSQPPASPTSSSVAHSSSTSRVTRPSNSPSRLNTQYQRRPSSTASASTSISKGSRSNLRSVSHGPVQIVLPAPLAPQLTPYGPSSRTRFVSDSNSNYRASMADQWAPLAVRSDGVPARRSSDVATAPSHQQTFSYSGRSRRRANSTASSHSAHHSISGSGPNPQITLRNLNVEPTPPVPRIPSMYNGSSSSPVSGTQQHDLDQSHEDDIGRSTRSSSVPRPARSRRPSMGYQ